MPINRSTQDDEDYISNGLEEGYWQALLHEGEYAKSVDNHHFDDTKDIALNNQTPYTLSQPSAQAGNNPSDWEVITSIQKKDEILMLAIIGFNRGGLLVEWESLRGFVPVSQLLPTSNSNSNVEQGISLEDYVGKTLKLRIIELHAEKNRLIFSERAAQVESGERSSILHNLTIDTVIAGHVTNICDFGAFIDLGGVEGLIHISELSWGRVAHPADMLTAGDKVNVYILDVNESQERIALSLKRLHDDPWARVLTRYQVGQIIEARITSVVDFGAFACIEEGLEGLIHFSELAEGQFLHPRNVVSENDIVKTRILSINSRARRLGLSLRNL
jgi:small subunit ribosomal protein S1